MPTFDFLPLVWWGLPLVAVPLVIHLINLLRHRRVEWAAMEFLLASRKKYRTRVLLRQWLLLALRTAAIAGLVLGLAQPRWRSAIGGLFGAGGHHLVLLDDSYSMGDLTSDSSGASESAFDRGRRVVERVAGDLAATGGSDELSLGLFSKLAGADESARLLVDRQLMDARGVQQVRNAVGRTQPSWLALGPRGPLAYGTKLVTAGSDAPRTAWIISDFRSRDWRPAETVAEVRRLAEAGWAIRLVDCSIDSKTAGNLAITRLEAVGGVPAAGVVMPVEVEVRNDGQESVRDLPLEIREDTVVRAGLRIAEIPPGGSVTRRFDVRFAETGGHVVAARLPADILPADDISTCVIDVVPSVEVLLVSDDPTGSMRGGDAFYLAAALAPGGGAATGLRPRVEPPAALTAIDLTPFDVIWVLDVERLEPPAINALEAHARSGGGVVFFCGPRTRADVVNRTLHRDGEGLFPLPLAGPVEVLPAPGRERVPDVVVEEHPVVAVLSGQRNPLLDAVRIDRVLAPDRRFDEAATPGLRRLLALRTGGPLLVEKPFGNGLGVAVLTTAGPEWNNWARGNPSWVVVMLELQNHLASQRRHVGPLRVGDRVVVTLQPGVDETEVDFLVPPDGAVVRQAAAAPPGKPFNAALRIEHPGICTARWRRVDGTERERLTAVSLVPDEGQLERIGRERLDRALVGIPFRYDRADALQPAADALAGVPFTKPLLLGLLVILLLEQFVAFVASYHPRVVPRGRA